MFPVCHCGKLLFIQVLVSGSTHVISTTICDVSFSCNQSDQQQNEVLPLILKSSHWYATFNEIKVKSFRDNRSNFSLIHFGQYLMMLIIKLSTAYVIRNSNCFRVFFLMYSRLYNQINHSPDSNPILKHDKSWLPIISNILTHPVLGSSQILPQNVKAKSCKILHESSKTAPEIHPRFLPRI